MEFKHLQNSQRNSEIIQVKFLKVQILPNHSNNFFSTQTSQVMCYWSLNTLNAENIQVKCFKIYTTTNLSNKSPNTQVSQLMYYWSLNTFEALNEILEHSKKSSQMFEVYTPPKLSNKPFNTQETQSTCFCIKHIFKEQKKTKKYLQLQNVPSKTSNALKR